LSSELYRILITPIEPFLIKNAQVFVVADKILNDVPFQSLFSPAGKYLVEDFAIELSPSSSVLIACTDAAIRKRQESSELMVGIGVTRFKHNETINLPNLPSAGRELRNIAANYSSAVLLIDEDAQKKRAMREIQKTNIIHVASHFITNPASPLRSRLLLFNEQRDQKRSESPDDVGAISASEIFNLKLPSARLAVLSACRTAMDRYYRGEGALGFAHAFIAADVPLVVASLWSVDSNATTELMINFHKNRKAQASSSAEALRRAQVAMLHGPESSNRHPYYWASFNLIGGYADY
jgi:CHAT domain-containing protein